MTTKCKHCDKEIFLGSDGVTWFDTTGDLPTLCAYTRKSHEPADWNRNSSLETWFPLTAEELVRVKAQLTALQVSHKALLEGLKASREGLQMAYKVPRPWIGGGISEAQWHECCEVIDKAKVTVDSVIAAAEKL